MRPVDERLYKVFETLQSKMSTEMQHLAGLHPLAWRYFMRYFQSNI